MKTQYVRPVITSADLAEKVMASIRTSQDTIRNIYSELDMANQQLEKEKNKLEISVRRRLKPVERKIETEVEALFIYAETFGKGLFRGKTAVLPVGSKMSKRLNPPYIDLKPRQEKRVIAFLKKLNLDECVRVKESVDKQSLLKYYLLHSKKRRIPFATVKQDEVFLVQPAGSKFNVEENIKALRRRTKKK